jgi:GTPase SAR1 family protein
MITDAPETIRCGNPACRVADTGKCIEGLETAICPSYGKAPDSLVNDLHDAEPPTEVAAIVFSLAQKLTIPETIELLRKRQSRVVAIIGPHKAGKTSLIASIHDLFQEGPIGSFEFAASSTLHAFEEASHDSRMESGRESPDTKRTQRGGVGFYHLDIGHNKTQECITLLLGDRAGEEYLEAADDIELMQELEEVERADVITLLADGMRLLDVGDRHNVISQIERILQVLQDANVLTGRQKLVLVMTKLDTVQDAKDDKVAARALQDFSKLKTDVMRKYTSVFESINSFQIAASPKSKTLMPGEGMTELLSCWLMPRKCQTVDLPVHIVPTRAIGRLALRRKKGE